MCLALDAAMAMVNLSIDYAEREQEPLYYMDSVKLHKLLYMSQLYMVEVYGKVLFENSIYAHSCGPYVEGIQSISGQRGFGLIKEPFKEGEEFARPSVARMEAMRETIKKYGKCATGEIITITKKTPQYRVLKERISKTSKPKITFDAVSLTPSRSERSNAG